MIGVMFAAFSCMSKILKRARTKFLAPNIIQRVAKRSAVLRNLQAQPYVCAIKCQRSDFSFAGANNLPDG